MATPGYLEVAYFDGSGALGKTRVVVYGIACYSNDSPSLITIGTDTDAENQKLAAMSPVSNQQGQMFVQEHGVFFAEDPFVTLDAQHGWVYYREL